MNRITPARAIVFACLLAAIAAVIIFFKVSHDQRLAAELEQKAEIHKQQTEQRQQEAERQRQEQAERQKEEAEKLAEQQRAAAAAKAEREKFLGYVNTNIVRNPGEEMIAVACESESGAMNSAISDALATHFKCDHVKFVSSFFRPTMITDGAFDTLFIGSKESFKKMELEKSLDGLLLAKQDVEYAKNDALDGVITADMHVQVETLPVTGQVESQTWTLAAKGTGFSNADARMQAEERIIHQINANTNMALSQFSANH